MPKVLSKSEEDEVLALVQKGTLYSDIVKIMESKYPDKWIGKDGKQIVKKLVQRKKKVVSTIIDEKTLDEMSRDERFGIISSRLKESPRFIAVFNNFDTNDKNLFITEYLSVVKSTDTLTEAEDQALFASILEYVLAFQALSRKEREERFLQQSLDGQILPTDPKFRTDVDDKYQKEYNQHMTLYQKGMEQLKMSRQQRLKEIRTERKTLVDLAEELSTKSAQSDAAQEISRLSKLRDDELKKMLENGYILGVFDD